MAPIYVIFSLSKNEIHSKPSSHNSILTFTNVAFKRPDDRARCGFVMSFDDSFLCTGPQELLSLTLPKRLKSSQSSLH